MNRVWDLFDSLLEGAAQPLASASCQTREYCMRSGNVDMSFLAHYAGIDRLHLSLFPAVCVRHLRELLALNATQSFWNAALRDTRVLLQTDVFISAPEFVKQVLHQLPSALDFLTGKPMESFPEPSVDSKKLSLLLSDIGEDVQELPDGTMALQLAHANRSFLVRCRILPGNMFECRSLLSTTKIESDEAAHYLLSRNAEITGCRLAVDDQGFPCAVACIPFSALEHVNIGSCIDSLADALSGVRHVEVLDDPAVRGLYHNTLYT